MLNQSSTETASMSGAGAVRSNIGDVHARLIVGGCLSRDGVR